MNEAEPSTGLRPQARITLVALLAIGCWLVLKPFSAAILFAVVIAVSTWPAYRWLLGRVKQRRALASLIACLAVLLAMVGPAVLLTVSLVDGVSLIVTTIRQWAEDGAPDPPAWLTHLPWIGADVRDYWDSLFESTDQIRALLRRVAEPAKNIAVVTGKILGGGLIQMAVAVFLLFFLYRDGDMLARRLREALERVAGRVALELLHTAENTIIGVMIGAVGTALAQSMVATLGFAIAGVPAAFLLGAATFVSSLIPIGPPLIWISSSIWLFMERGAPWAIFMFAYGLLAISSVDNIVKPFLISRTSKLSVAVSLLGVTGGVVAFGFMGLFLGPTLLALALALTGRWLDQPASDAAAINEAPQPSSSGSS